MSKSAIKTFSVDYQKRKGFWTKYENGGRRVWIPPMDTVTVHALTLVVPMVPQKSKSKATTMAIDVLIRELEKLKP